MTKQAAESGDFNSFMTQMAETTEKSVESEMGAIWKRLPTPPPRTGRSR